MVFSIYISLAACQELAPEEMIPELTYADSSRSFRILEPFNPVILFGKTTLDYESAHAVYHFDENIPQDRRDQCVYYADRIISRMDPEKKPELLIIAGYGGAWTDGTLCYLGDMDFSSEDFGARLISVLCGGYANYGAAYGYAAYILEQEPSELPALPDTSARDLNWLCFREEFVTAEEIAVNKNAACVFACDYIECNGESEYVNLLKASGSPETVDTFNKVLSAWYQENGLDYMPSQVLYGIGGEHHDYLVQHAHATMYMAKTWENFGWRSDLVQDNRFLHESYETVKYSFELTKIQMELLQESLGFNETYEPITVEFLSSHGISRAYPYHAKLDIGDFAAFCHEYAHYLTTEKFRYQSTQYLWLDEGLTDYLAMTVPNPYEYAAYEYSREHGLPVQASITGDWNDVYRSIVADMENPMDIWRVRWDMYAYYYEEYDLNGIGGISFTAYLIDTLGYDTVYHYGYLTDQDPPELDLVQLREAWGSYLEENYGQYPRYVDYLAQTENG